ncbi:hypothetical protein Tco_0020171 [Tanacetum coccineum]
MGCCLASWSSKKQTTLAISTTEAKYVSAGKACQQALWMKQALVDYDIKLEDIPVLCDKKGSIDINRRFPSISKAGSILHMEPAEPADKAPPLSPITSPGISASHLLTTHKTTPPTLTSSPPAPSQPSKQSSPLAINLDPVELMFLTPPTSPYPFFDSLEDLPPRTTNPPPSQPSFNTIERLANQPRPLPAMEPPLPPMPPHLSPLGPKNPFPLLTHEMFCDHCQRTQVIVNDLREEMRFILNHILECLDVLSYKIHP